MVKRWFNQGYGWFFLFWFILDVITKQWAALTNVNVEVIPEFFYLAYSRNTGAAWSIFSDQLPLLALISASVGIGFGWYYFRRYEELDRWHHLAMSMFLAGTWGNFIDRALFPEGVIDFLSFHFGSYIFPTFNIADTALTLGVIALIALSFFEKKPGSAHGQ